jgi:small subunit ribosomal protein S6
MRPYEVMVIFDADLEEETIRSAVDQSVALIESKGAERGPIDWWGKRRLAYEVKHRWEGYYVVLQVRAEPPAMDDLHRSLSLSDDVIRHKILRIPEQVYGKLGVTPTSDTDPTQGGTGKDDEE